MAWSGSLTASSAVGSAITYTPDTTTQRAYTSSLFTAPKKGIYRFTLKGSGGTLKGETWVTRGTPGKGGLTVGYMLMEPGQSVYVGAGGTLSAAFVSKTTGAKLKDIPASDLYFVAGAGGQNGAAWDSPGGNYGGNGGDGGGTTGAGAPYVGPYPGGGGGTQTAGGSSGTGESNSKGAYGEGRGGFYGNVNGTSHIAGAGGDGYYGGGGGTGGQAHGAGGGGGSGYIHTTTVKVNSKTFTNTTQQGGGAGSNARGSVEVSYYARAELPIIFNGTTLERLIYNGVEIESLIYDGVRLFMRRMRECLNSMVPAFA